MSKNISKKIRGIAADAIIIKNRTILLIKRKNNPFKNYYALPGGFVGYNEICEKGCIREVFEETGLKVNTKKLIGVYSNPKRDPREHTISICFECVVKSGELKASDDAICAEWVSLNKIPQKMAFDHKKMINDFKTL